MIDNRTDISSNAGTGIAAAAAAAVERAFKEEADKGLVKLHRNVVTEAAHKVQAIIDDVGLIWKNIEKIQLIADQFFKFEIEEDDLKRQLQKVKKCCGICKFLLSLFFLFKFLLLLLTSQYNAIYLCTLTLL